MPPPDEPPPFPEASFMLSANRPADFPSDAGAEVAFAGRSNSGKSSVLNALAGRRALARTSKTPGRTQLVNFFSLRGPNEARLVDLPGYGYARVPDSVRAHWRALMSAYFERRRSLAGLLLIMDVRRPLTDFDQQMLAWVIARDCSVHVLLNKADKLKRGPAASTLLRVRRELGGQASVQLFSALRRTGVAEARATALHMLGYPAAST